ncbi:MAG TPA: hypothetical protein VJB10_02470 [Candidatus Peribacteraceae bacterium]|nr:hypothetical protein [Candidatus Peribacteraceae bacterium]
MRSFESFFGSHRDPLPIQLNDDSHVIHFDPYESHVGHIAGAVALAVQDESIKSFSPSKLRKDPYAYIVHSCATARQSPASIHRQVRNVMDICKGADVGIPSDTTRILQRINVEEVSDPARISEIRGARDNIKTLLGMLAEDGELEAYYAADHAAVRHWVDDMAKRVRDSVIRFFTDGSTEPGQIAQAKEHPDRLAKILFATSMALTELDVRIQQAIGNEGRGYDKVSFSVLGKALNDIRRAILSTVIVQVSAWWPAENFPLQGYLQEMRKLTGNAGEIRPERINPAAREAPKREQEAKFQAILRERLPINTESLAEANGSLERVLQFPAIAHALRTTELPAKAADGDTYFPHGYVVMLSRLGNGMTVHYAADGVRKTQTVGLKQRERTCDDVFEPYSPPGTPPYATLGFHNVQVAQGGHLFTTPSTLLAPSMPFEDFPALAEPVLASVRTLNAQMQQLSVKYAKVFALSAETSPMIFVEIPGSEVVLFPANEGLSNEVMHALGVQKFIIPEHIQGSALKLGIGLGDGRWAMPCQPELARAIDEHLRPVSPARSPGDMERIAHANGRMDPLALEQACQRDALRGYVRPTLKDMLRILADVEEVISVEHREKQGRGSGNHGEILLMHTDGTTRKQNTWGKIQHPNARISWVTVFEMLGEGKLNIPLSNFIRAVETGKHLKHAENKAKQPA